MGTIFKALEKLPQNIEGDLNSSNNSETATLLSPNHIDKSYIVENRRSIRQEIFFHGHIVESHIQGYTTQKLIKSKIIVTNLSMHGIRIRILEKVPLKDEKIIEIEFKLDDSKRSKILREVRIKKIIPPVDIGCEFLSTEHYGYLNQYFLSHF